jgi:hypothetical protein
LINRSDASLRRGKTAAFGDETPVFCRGALVFCRGALVFCGKTPLFCRGPPVFHDKTVVFGGKTPLIHDGASMERCMAWTDCAGKAVWQCCDGPSRRRWFAAAKAAWPVRRAQKLRGRESVAVGALR